MDKITAEKLAHYFDVSTKACAKAQAAPENLDITDNTRADFLDMIQRYLSDAQHFADAGRTVDAFAALNYAHGWLDAGARLGLWDVGDATLFTVDDHKKVDPEATKVDSKE